MVCRILLHGHRRSTILTFQDFSNRSISPHFEALKRENRERVAFNSVKTFHSLYFHDALNSKNLSLISTIIVFVFEDLHFTSEPSKLQEPIGMPLLTNNIRKVRTIWKIRRRNYDEKYRTLSLVTEISSTFVTYFFWTKRTSSYDLFTCSSLKLIKYNISDVRIISTHRKSTDSFTPCAKLLLEKFFKNPTLYRTRVKILNDSKYCPNILTDLSFPSP